MKEKKLVVVGLSGGVDSSVAAYILKREGYEVVGMFMKNWHDGQLTLSGECPWKEDIADAEKVADKLGIHFEAVDLSEIYKEKVVDYMISEYRRGRTPNPDVLCNREIKFDAFMDVAMELGADYVATGHYSRRSVSPIAGKDIYHLLSGVDRNKDQSYFLCQLTQEQLSKSLFPIGELTKPGVRRIAREQGFVTAGKKDSQGICFVGKVRLPDFLQAYLAPRQGEVVVIPAEHPVFEKNERDFDNPEAELEYLSRSYPLKKEYGTVAGIHQGAQYYTVGQRKGLGIGGTREPLYIIGIDTDQNIIYAGEGKRHPGLYRNVLAMASDETHWVRRDLEIAPGESIEVSARIRYRQPLQQAVLYRFESKYYLRFDEPQSAITPGQFAVWYIGEELIGSGVIDR